MWFVPTCLVKKKKKTNKKTVRSSHLLVGNSLATPYITLYKISSERTSSVLIKTIIIVITISR